MTRRLAWSLCLVSLAAPVGCSKGPTGPAADLAMGAVDLAINALADFAGTTADLSMTASQLPSWMLEDVQPNSPRTGQTYGLNEFLGRTLVVTLVEGF
jgi:hypothetical protein